MNKLVVTKYQPSMTEWFSQIGRWEESKAFRKENDQKVDRLELLYQEISLPYERPVKLPACELANKTPVFQKILKNRGDELCALRLIPIKDNLTRLRVRGLSIRESYRDWFSKQKINCQDYLAYICPHSDKVFWSGIIVVNSDAIFGELIRGQHSQLTQGNTTSRSYQFSYNFKSWQWSKIHQPAIKIAKEMIKLLKVSDSPKRESLKSKINAHFFHNFLEGYFETVVWPDKKVYFTDYNRILPKYIPTPKNILKHKEDQGIQGIMAYSGKIKGKVVKVNENNLSKINFPKGSILVCDNTDVRYLPYMQKSGAIVTDRGGILSHAAIISRELKIPCIIGTKIATKVLEDGDLVEVDADKGVVKKIR